MSHCGLQYLLRFCTRNPNEALWTFYAALTFWAIVKFGTELNIPSSASKRTVVTCKSPFFCLLLTINN